jgi:hypothetical protein
MQKKKQKRANVAHEWTPERCPHLALYLLRGRRHTISPEEARAELKEELKTKPRTEIEGLAQRIAQFQGGVEVETLYGGVLDFLLALQAEAVNPAPDPNPDELL